jgi:hypothetical protein
MRGVVLAGLSAGAVADLAMVPYFKSEIPPVPGCYAFMKRATPGAAFVEIPQFGSGGSDLYAICAYWQSFHRGRTTAGYCGQGNAVFDNLLTFNSPFLAEALAQPGFLEDPDRTPLVLGGDVVFRDYAWLYLKGHDFRYVVLHQWPGAAVPSVGLDRLKAVLQVAKVYEDEGSVVYDRDRLALPEHAVMLTTRGWRIARGEGMLRVADRQAHLSVYNPEPDRELRLTLDAKSLHEPRQVRLVAAGKVLAHWAVRPGEFQSLACPPFHLPAGLHDLVLESDGASRPRSRREAAIAGDMGAFSLRVDKLEIEATPRLARRLPAALQGRAIGEEQGDLRPSLDSRSVK